MVSPEFKKWFPVVMVPTVAAASIAAVAIGILNMKNAVRMPQDEVFVWPTPSASASPFPTYSASPTPKLSEAPSDDATTPAPEDTIYPTPTLSSTPNPHKTTANPTNKPLNAVITTSHYESTGVNSGLAFIDSETRDPSGGAEHTHSSEFKLLCGAYVVKIGVVSFTDEEQDVLKKPTEHPELTATLCDGSQVTPDLRDDPSRFAGYLLPLANIS